MLSTWAKHRTQHKYDWRFFKGRDLNDNFKVSLTFASLICYSHSNYPIVTSPSKHRLALSSICGSGNASMVTIKIYTRGGKQREYCVRMDQQREVQQQMQAEQGHRVRIE